MAKANLRRTIEFVAAVLLSAAVIWGLNYRAGRMKPAKAGVIVLNIEGTIAPGLDTYVARGLKEAALAGAKAVLVEIDTLGGRLDAMDRIVELLQSSPVTVYTYVRGSAGSAGALIALTGKKIAMAPDSAIGAAAPVAVGGEMDETRRQKETSFLRAKFRAAAERLRREGRPELRPEIAEGMVDPAMVIPGIKAKGELVSLSAEEALKLHYSDLIAGHRREVLRAFGLGGLKVRECRPMPAEGLVRFLTDPTVSTVLLALGLLGLLVEVFTPGFGGPGIVGLLGLGLFFGARLLAGLAGMEVIFLFTAGLLLLAIDLFFVPGFGLLGLLGLLGLAASVILAYPDPYQALAGLGGAVFTTFLLGGLLFRYLERRAAFRPILLETRLTGQEGYTAVPDHRHLVGASGRTLTPLRPAGVALIDGDRVDVTSEGGFIPAETAVRVVRVEGNRVVVRPVVEG